MEDAPDLTFFPGEEEIRARTRRRVHIGILMMFSPLFLLLVIFLIQDFTP